MFVHTPHCYRGGSTRPLVLLSRSLPSDDGAVCTSPARQGSSVYMGGSKRVCGGRWTVVLTSPVCLNPSKSLDLHTRYFPGQNTTCTLLFLPPCLQSVRTHRARSPHFGSSAVCCDVQRWKGVSVSPVRLSLQLIQDSGSAKIYLCRLLHYGPRYQDSGPSKTFEPRYVFGQKAVRLFLPVSLF